MSWLRDRHGDHVVRVTAPEVYRLLGCFVISVLPQFGNVSFWLLAVTAGLVLWRVQMEKQSAPLPSSLIKLLLGISLLLAVYVEKGTLAGRDSGTALMVGLIAVKFLELRTRRDYMVLTFVIYFMSVTALLFEQNILVFGYVMTSCAFLTVNLIALHWHSPEGNPTLEVSKFALRLAVQALPLALILFLFYPRVSARYGFNLGSTTTGLPDKIRAGAFESFTEDQSMAFRVDFPEERIPPIASLYWRGFILWNYDASSNEWTLRSPVPDQQDLAGNLSGGKLITQRITLRPHSTHWLFALDYPNAPAWNGQASLNAGYVLQIERDLHRKIQYTAVSRFDSHPVKMPNQMKTAALQVSSELIHPEVVALAAQLRGAGDGDEKVVENALQYFRAHNFQYTIQAVDYGEDPLYEFLFVKQRGFCEHFASAFTVLMRLAGIPSRVVVGYLGGEYNPYGNFVVVRQLNAHAWSEVFIKDKGWIRVDPTTTASPSGSPSNTTNSPSTAQTGTRVNRALDRKWTPSWWKPMERESRLRWQLVEEKWDQWVLSYTPELQTSILKNLRLDQYVWELFTIVGAIGLGLTLYLVGNSMRHRLTAQEQLQRIYRQFCTDLENAGVPRHSWEGPTQYAARAGKILTHAAVPIKKFTREYTLLRYGQITYLEEALAPLQEKADLVREALIQAELKVGSS